VCFEHSGLLSEGAQPACESVPGCITCSDEGRLAEVLESGADTAEVRTAEGPATVDTMAVGAVRPGDLLLVHAGAAIAVLEEAGHGA
jgi:hydrogenase maturation factor